MTQDSCPIDSQSLARTEIHSADDLEDDVENEDSLPGCDAEDEDAPDPEEGVTLVEACYEYTMWGDDRWLIAGYERPSGTWGIYDFQLGEWLAVVPAADAAVANARIVDDWLENSFCVASIPTDLSLDGLWRTDIRRLLTRRIAFEDADVDGAVEAAPLPNQYESSDILAVWAETVDVEHTSAGVVLTADQIDRYFTDADDAAVPDGSSAWESWLQGATVRWSDNGEILTGEEARALLHLCRYIAACCR